MRNLDISVEDLVLTLNVHPVNWSGRFTCLNVQGDLHVFNVQGVSKVEIT